MGRFMKYEMRGISRFIITVLIALIIASTIIQVSIYKQVTSPMMETQSLFNVLIVALSVLVIWAAIIISFFYIVNSFNKELSEDTGYLTFTLPLKGTEILGAKLLSAFISMVILGTLTFLYNGILGIIFTNVSGREIFAGLRELLSVNGFVKGMITIIVMGIISAFVNLLLIYFSMTLRKISFGGKKLNWLWFIIFIVLSGITGYIIAKIGSAIPLYWDLMDNSLASMSNGFGDMNMLVDIGFNPVINFGPNGMGINITSILAEIVVGIFAFFGTSYMLENKIDL